jgi:hypothetical protein
MKENSFYFERQNPKYELPVLLGARVAVPLLSRGPSAGFPWEYGLPQLRNNRTAMSTRFSFQILKGMFHLCIH